MKKWYTFLIVVLFTLAAFSQDVKKDILGTWEMSNDQEYIWTFNEDGRLIENRFGNISNYTYKFVNFNTCKSRFTETEYKIIINITDKQGDSTCYGVSLTKLEGRHDLSLENLTSGMEILLLEKYFD